jgi:hypothetical protein
MKLPRDYDSWKSRSDLDDWAAQNHPELPDADERFDVWQFFPSGLHERVREGVPAKEAVKAAHHYTHNVASKLGLVERVIITGDGDDCVFEWRRGEGVTFPPECKGKT